MIAITADVPRLNLSTRIIQDQEQGQHQQQPESPLSTKEATLAFDTLSRTLTSQSTLHRTVTHQKIALDEEKDIVDEDDFDLERYLRDNHQERRANANSQADKGLGVIWDDMQVFGGGAGFRMIVPTFPGALRGFVTAPFNLVRPLFTAAFERIVSPSTVVSTAAPILHSFDGFARPGEMVLVVGRPGSGCSTFLKTIANERVSYSDVKGSVSYGGISSQEMAKRYKGEVAYNQEEDLHYETLTVQQTIMFALRTKTPGKLLPEETRRGFRQSVSALLLNMLGISHTANTLVGSAFVRGVSGGERKRVSLAETMVTRASVACWDNSSRGLDASSALDFAKSLRIMTDIYRMTTFVSLYQAGEYIYEQFDKVLVIDSGRLVYYGSISLARQYFTDIGFVPNLRQTTADFLTGCTDTNERKIGTRSDGRPVPITPEDLEAEYRKSEIYSTMLLERDMFREELRIASEQREEFRAAVVSDKRKGVSKGSIFTVSFFTQVKALVIRQFQLKLQDRSGLIVSFLTAVGISAISGSVYFNLPTSSSYSFVRGGVVFISVLFNAFSAFSELPAQMITRGITSKQVNYAFYRPAALTVAATLADAPVNMLKIFLFCIIIYFLSGLYRSFEAFITFYAIVVSGFFALASLFRLLGTVCRSFDIAARLAAVLVTAMILYSGYLIPIFSMKGWLSWLYYINPLSYCFSAAMINEFSRIDIECEGTSIIPRNIGNLTRYPTSLGPNQVCTLVGSVPGNPIVSGSDYILANFDYVAKDLWRNFGITLLFFFGCLALQMFVAERVGAITQLPQITIYAEESDELKALNEKLQSEKGASRRGEIDQLRGSVTSRRPLTWESLSYSVPFAGGEKQLLNKVFGYVKPGTLTALIGASGAGKTTLLDVLANRKNVGVISGDRKVGGLSIGRDFQRATAYVEQNDVHEPTTTVREAFRFSAYLRQDPLIPKKEKDAYVEEVIQLLELEDMADSMIGFAGFGLSIEAKKRVTIGVELASRPQLLLFLDEPTSGLDSQSAQNLVRFLRKLANAGQAILVTVHQPNSLLFESFDRLLLLKSGGRCVYFGDIGVDSKVVRSYFNSKASDPRDHCPVDANPAEFILEAIGAGSRRAIGKIDWADIWLESDEFLMTKQEIERLNAESLETIEENGVKMEYATSFLTQLRIVTKRTSFSFWRRPDYGLTRLSNHVIVPLFVSLTFLGLDSSLVSLQYRVFAIFFVTFLPALIISQVEPTFIGAREIFYRENSSKMYSQMVFASAQIIAEIPYSILCAVSFFLLFYYPIGFNRSTDRAGYQFLMVLTVETFAVTLGQAVASLSPSVFFASSVNPFILVITSLFCGITIPPPSMPAFWRAWLLPLDPLTRIISGMVSTELNTLKITCIPRELISFIPPANQSCVEWAGDFVALAGGYLADPLATDVCRYCQYSLGNQFFEPLGISFDSRWRDWGILVCFCLSNGVIAIAASKWINYSKR